MDQSLPRMGIRMLLTLELGLNRCTSDGWWESFAMPLLLNSYGGLSLRGAQGIIHLQEGESPVCEYPKISYAR